MTTDKHNKRPNVPPLRFPEFTDEWETRKLSEFTERVTRKNKGQTNLPLTISAQYGLVDQISFFNNKVASADMSNYYLLKKGEFTYNKSYSTDYPLGAIKRLDRYEMGALSTLYICFKINGDIESDFLVHYFESPKWHRGVYEIAGEGARNHGLLNIAVGDFFETQHFRPKSIREQEKIAHFLTLIQHRIEVQSGLIEDLQKLKAALVERLFCNKQGWKRYKYRDLLSPISERNSGNQFSNVLSASQELGMVSRTDLDIDIKFDRSAVTTYKIVRNGDYVLHLRSFQGGLAFSSMTGICSPAYTILRPKKELEYGFFQEYFMSKSFINSLRLVTYGIRDGRSINVDEFLEMPVGIPDSDTQCRIISILSIMNRRLRLAIKQKENYIKQKQYLLQQMFI
jgi:type I restriction enzyme S subunit